MPTFKSPYVPPSRLTFRLSTLAFVAAAFLGGLGFGLIGAHAAVEADLALAELEDPAAAHARHGDDVVVHGLVFEKSVDAEAEPGATTFTYVIVLDDGSARVRFPVPRQSHESLEQKEWVTLPLRWDGKTYVAGAPEGAIQPWMWTASFVAAALAGAAGVASRVNERGVSLKRRGDVVEIRAER